MKQLDEKLRDRLNGMRPWYDAPFTVHPIAMFLIAWLIAGLPLYFLTSIELSTGENPVVVLSFLYAIGVTAVLAMLRLLVFPRAAFAIGQGKDRHENGEKIRLVIVVGFIVSLLSGLLILGVDLALTGKANS